MDRVLLAGLDGVELLSGVEAIISDARPRVLGIAIAYVSVQGLNELHKLLRRRLHARRLIAGLDHAITHPEALNLAAQKGWQVRICKIRGGIFHPKFVVGGSAFDKSGGIHNPCCTYIGSGNLTRGGLRQNVECGVITTNEERAQEASDAFGLIWRNSKQLSKKELTNYAAYFAQRNRQRSPDDIVSLGINDTPQISVRGPKELLKTIAPRKAAVSEAFAAKVWAGLASFTGEYALQVEFPKSAGKVLHRLVGTRTLRSNKVAVTCDDNETRAMTFRYYPDNALYRLNVPNSVPGVQRARHEKSGIALVARGPEGGPPISLTLLPPGREMNEVIARSLSLGTWGKTQTRLYGWF